MSDKVPLASKKRTKAFLKRLEGGCSGCDFDEAEGGLMNHCDDCCRWITTEAYDIFVVRMEIERLTRELDEALERIGKLQLVGSQIASERDWLRAALDANAGLLSTLSTPDDSVAQAVLKMAREALGTIRHVETSGVVSHGLGKVSAADVAYLRGETDVMPPVETPSSLQVPSGWRGKDPWFKVGDRVLPLNALYRHYPVHTITEITERGFKYSHARMPWGPARNGAWTEGGETFEPCRYELAAQNGRASR